MRKCETFLELFKKIIQVKGAIYSDFEVKFKWSFCFLFLGYCDDITDSIMEQYTENTAELLEKSTSLKTSISPPLSSSY